MKNLSVIIPTYNTDERTLERSIRSALGQTLEGMEILVYDDNDDPKKKKSVQNLVEKIRPKRSTKAPKLYYIEGGYYAPMHSGPSDARKAAVEESCGEYVTMLDADDEFYERDSCRILFEKIRANSSSLPDIVQGKIIVPDKRNAILDAHPDAYEYIEKSCRETLSFSEDDELISAFLSENKTEYAKLADAAEKEFMGKTFRDFLYEE